MRLNKFLALGTGLARRKADEVIKAGEVIVNGKKGTVGMIVDPEKDEVILRSKKVELPEERIVMAMNKPAGVVTSREGFENRAKTVYDLLPKEWKKLRYVGRLDKETTGLLVFTNDGDMIEELTHPKFEHEKEYRVRAMFPIQIEEASALQKGMMLEDGWAQAAEVNMEDAKTIRIIITEGRKRMIRRMCQRAGIRIEELERVRIGRLYLKNLDLKKGKFRELSEVEISLLIN